VNTNPANSSLATGNSPAGEAMSAADAARIARRAKRLALIDFICDANVQAAEKLTGYINGDVPEDRLGPFQRLQDPFLALTRVTHAIQQCVLLQERLDEDDAAREKRLAEEKAAREREIQTRLAQSRAEEKRCAVAARKQQVGRAVELAIAAGAPAAMNAYFRSEMTVRLNELEQLEDLTEGPVSAIVQRLCRDIHLPFDPDQWDDEPWAIAEAAAKADAVSGSPPAPPPRDGHAAGAVVRLHPPANGHDPP